jgi:hypothetical protein
VIALLLTAAILLGTLALVGLVWWQVERHLK